MNTSIDFQTATVKDIILLNIKAANIFEKYNIDFCCHGNESLLAAIDKNNLPAGKVIDELKYMLEKADSSTENFYELDAKELVNYIINQHHSYVKNSLPTIDRHLQKVVSKHSEMHPYLNDIVREFSLLADELLHHMNKEEKVLFPLINYLVDTKNFSEKPKTRGYGTVQNPIRQMIFEHDNAGNLIQEIRKLSNGFFPPEDACTTFSLVYSELEEFEKDLHQHIHLENNILFPKAIKLEEELTQ